MLNNEYKFAIEYCSCIPERDDGFRLWHKYNKYKTIMGMLQALKQLRYNEANCKKRCKVSYDGGNTYYEYYLLFRPIHVE